MKIFSSLPLAVLLTVSLLIAPSTVTGQQYDQGGYGGDDQGYGDQDDFAQDNLYADYAAKQQEKAVGGGYVTVIFVLSFVHSVEIYSLFHLFKSARNARAVRTIVTYIRFGFKVQYDEKTFITPH
jgi:hypothetical protein